MALGCELERTQGSRDLIQEAVVLERDSEKEAGRIHLTELADDEGLS